MLILKTFSLPHMLGFLTIVAVAIAQTGDDLAVDPLVKAWLDDMNGEGDASSTDDAETFAPLVNVRNGTIRGRTGLSVDGRIIYQYLGIPFAAPPLGNLRFKAPQPYQGWGDDVYVATRHPPACTQFRTNLTKAGEDCLFLSVHSRRSPGAVGNGPPLPVVVFIHGGGFAFGQNSIYSGIKLLNDEEIVLVSIQYRLGIFGFFSTGDSVVPGNNGLKDMVQGLRWVQENIEAFGGDKNNVTVMGESAGSASALYMLISPLAQGLFHKVIGMSGSFLQEWAIDRDPAKSAKRLGKLLNCSTDTSAELVDCLMDMDWLPIVQAGVALIMEDFKNFKIFLSGNTPVIEGDVPGAFLPDDPLKLLSEGPLPDVPVLLGTVQHEGDLPLAGVHFLVLHPEGLLNDTLYMRERFMGDLLTTYEVNEKQNGASVSQALAAGFLKPGADLANFTENQYELLDLLTVLFMKAPVLRTADILSRRISSVYLYNFEHYNSFGSSLYNLVFTFIQLIIGGVKPPMKPGICHADDLMYMFRLPFILSPTDTIFSRRYCRLFTNFIAHGDPTPEPSDVIPKWPTYNLDSKYYMKIDNPMQVKQDYTSNWKLGMPGI